MLCVLGELCAFEEAVCLFGIIQSNISTHMNCSNMEYESRQKSGPKEP